MTRFPQSAKTTRRVGEFLTNTGSDTGSRFGNLMQRAAYLMQLESLLSSLVEPDLVAQFQVAAVRKNRLILISPTASWATRLRMQAPQLVGALHAAGLTSIEHIDIRVAPLVRQSTESRSSRPLSDAAKTALEHMADLTAGDED
jgi:hypothetical protein